MSRKSFARKYTDRHATASTGGGLSPDDAQVGRRAGLAEQLEHDATAVTEDEELAGLIDAEAADVPQLRRAAERGRVLHQAGGRCVAIAGEGQANRPDAAADEIGEEVAAAVRGAERAAAIDVAGADRCSLRAAVVEVRIGQRQERGRRVLHAGVRIRRSAFTHPPSVVAAAAAARLVVDLFTRVLSDIADHQRARPAERDVVEAVAPRVAEPERPDLRTHTARRAS